MTNSSREPTSGWIENGAHVLPVRVYYEDTDFSRVVYYGTYMQFIERGRSEYLRLAGVLHRDLAEGAEPLMWVVRRIAVEYLKPALLDDALLVYTRPVDLSGARIKLAQEIRRGADLLLTADIEVAIVANGKPQRIPADIRTKLEKLSP